jgi:hypothetical protein
MSVHLVMVPIGDGVASFRAMNSLCKEAAFSFVVGFRIQIAGRASSSFSSSSSSASASASASAASSSSSVAAASPSTAST